MATYDNTYSRVVAWLKIILPLAALALMSTVFLVARTIDPAQDLPFADVDITELTREQRLGTPSFSGVTADGAAITITADVVRPNLADGQMASGAELRATVVLPEGGELELSAADGVIDTTTQTAELGGGVLLTTSNGYRVETNRLAALLDRTKLESGGAVAGSGPIGTLNAGHLTITKDTTSGTYRMLFDRGVKLVYEPSQ